MIATISMKTYLVGYDLRAGQNYTSLIQAIKKAGSGWWHYLDSTWLITANANAGQIRDYLQPHVPVGDRLLVAPLEKKLWASLGLDAEAVNWLNSNA
jgi:hypothetical protein